MDRESAGRKEDTAGDERPRDEQEGEKEGGETRNEGQNAAQGGEREALLRVLDWGFARARRRLASVSGR